MQTPGGDSWDAWGGFGECSRSCGSGVTLRTRRCVTHRFVHFVLIHCKCVLKPALRPEDQSQIKFVFDLYYTLI